MDNTNQNLPAQVTAEENKLPVIGGVAAVIADKFEINPLHVRGVMLGALFFSMGTVGVLYLIASALINPAKAKVIGNTARQLSQGNSTPSKALTQLNSGEEVKNQNPVIMGVCNEISLKFDWSPQKVRTVMLIALLISVGSVGLLYLLGGAFINPEKVKTLAAKASEKGKEALEAAKRIDLE